MKAVIFTIVFFLLIGTVAAFGQTKAAVMYCTEYTADYKEQQTPILSSLGWTQDTYSNAQAAELANKLNKYDIVILGTLFNYKNIQDLSLLGKQFRDYISSGGCLVVTDACYAQQFQWLKSIDPGLIWKDAGILTDAQNTPAIRVNPEHPLMNGVETPILAWNLPEYTGVSMIPLVTYPNGRPAATVTEIGKGTIVVSTLSRQHGWPSAKFLDNLVKWTKDPSRIAKAIAKEEATSKRSNSHPTLDMPVMAAAPKIDGTIETSEWDNAALIPELYDMTGGYAYTQPTKCRLGRYKDDLYILFECTDTDIANIVKDLTARDDRYWDNDSVEFFLDPTGERNTYFHFGLGCSGVMYDARMTETNWDGYWQAKTSIGDKGWIAEIRVPFASLGEDAIASKGIWAANFCRTARPGSEQTRENTNWSPTFGYFHKPEQFGTLPGMSVNSTNYPCSPVIETKLPKTWFTGANRLVAIINGHSGQSAEATLELIDSTTGKSITSCNITAGKVKSNINIDFDLDSSQPRNLQLLLKDPEDADHILACSGVIRAVPIPEIDVRIISPTFRTNVQSKDPVKKLLAECIIGSQSKSKMNLAFSIKDQSGNAVFTMRRGVSSRRPLKIAKDLSKLAYGNYTLNFELSDSFRIIATRDMPLVIAPPAKTEVTFTADKTCYVNGKPFFPIGLYHVSPAAVSSINVGTRLAGLPEVDLWDSMKQVKQHGFNVIHHTWGMPTDEYLQKAEEQGLWVVPEVASPTAEQVATANKFSNILMWYGSDEPSGERLIWIRDALAKTSKLDPNRPVSAAVCSPDLFKPALQGFDFVMMDPYLIRYSPLSGIANWIQKGNDACNGTKPIWMVPQAFTIGNSPWSEPTGEELRCEAYISLVHGVKGFIWYAFWTSEQWKDNPKGRNQWFLPDSKLWDYFTILNKEVSDMAPVYLTGKSKGPISCSSKEIHTNQWTYKGKTYVMAVNPTNKTVRCEIGGFKDKKTEVLFESRKVEPTNNKLKETFKPLETHLYKY